MVKSKYYFLGSQNKTSIAVACTLDEPPISYELIPLLEGKSILPFELVLKKVIKTKDGFKLDVDLSGIKYLWQDYQPNCLAWPILSEKTKTIIENNLTGQEDIGWIELFINGFGEKKRYYLLRFNKKLDVLDSKKTRYASGTKHIVQAHFSKKKISKLSLFHVPESNDFWKIPSGIYINQTLKEDLEAARVTGVEYDQISEKRIV